MRLLRATLLRVDRAENLAVFRIVVASILLGYGEIYAAPHWASLPESVRVVPGGLGFLLARLPISANIARMVLVVLVAALASGLVGFYARTSFLIATVAGFYVLGISELSGTPFHHHHLLWFVALLAASPCGDALSVDAWRARRRGVPPQGPSVAYGFPIRIAWLLLGAIYFFPGVWKLRSSGLEWCWSDNLRNQLYAKWFQLNDVPALRLDHFPLLCRLAATGVVLFELTFVFAVFVDRLRPWAVAGALLFHAGSAYWMGIHFSALWFSYVVFFDWSRFFAARAVSDSSRPPAVPTLIASAGLLIGATWTGFRGEMSSWPFACYPTFQWTVGATSPALDVVVVDAAGRSHPVPRDWLTRSEGTNHHWGLSWSLLGDPNPERFTEYWRFLQLTPKVAALGRGASAVRFNAAVVSTVPEERAAPPLQTRLLYELKLSPTLSGNGPAEK